MISAKNIIILIIIPATDSYLQFGDGIDCILAEIYKVVFLQIYSSTISHFCLMV